MRFLLIILSVSGCFSAFSQQSQTETQVINNGPISTQTTTGNTTITTTVMENKLDIEQSERPQRTTTKSPIQGEEKKKTNK